MTEWHAVIPPPAVATTMMRPAIPAPSKRVVAPAGSGTVGNDAHNRHPAPDARVRHPVVVPPRHDSDRPTGPPPAFEANVLEADAERRRQKVSALAEAPHRIPAESTTVKKSIDRNAAAENGATAHHRPRAATYSELTATAEPQINLVR